MACAEHCSIFKTLVLLFSPERRASCSYFMYETFRTIGRCSNSEERARNKEFYDTTLVWSWARYFRAGGGGELHSGDRYFWKFTVLNLLCAQS